MSLIRSKRDFGLAIDNEITVGPGSYGIDHSKSTFIRSNPSAVPFSSSSQRLQNVIIDDTIPGPGTYYHHHHNNNNTNSNDHHHHHHHHNMSPFDSRVQRFHSFKDDLSNVGPGSYYINNQWNTTHTPILHPLSTTSTTSSSSSLQYSGRLHTAPSIPTAQQAYGYVEGSDGNLVPQSPPVDGSITAARSSAISSTSHLSHTAVNYHMNKTKREFERMTGKEWIPVRINK